MQKSKSKHLLSITSKLNKLDIIYCLLWETAIFGWGISNNGHLQIIDVLISEKYAKEKLVKRKDFYCSKNSSFRDVRFWTTNQLKLNNEIIVTECEGYKCYALSPELQLQKMQYFPEKNQYQEDIAKLAASVYADELTKSDYEYYSKYIRN